MTFINIITTCWCIYSWCSDFWKPWSLKPKMVNRCSMPNSNYNPPPTLTVVILVLILNSTIIIAINVYHRQKQQKLLLKLRYMLCGNFNFSFILPDTLSCVLYSTFTESFFSTDHCTLWCCALTASWQWRAFNNRRRRRRRRRRWWWWWWWWWRWWWWWWWQWCWNWWNSEPYAASCCTGTSQLFQVLYRVRGMVWWLCFQTCNPGS